METKINKSKRMVTNVFLFAHISFNNIGKSTGPIYFIVICDKICIMKK